MMRQSLKDASVTRLHRASFTASFGVSGMSDLQRDLLPAIRRADQALYHAKRNGRDRVECASGLEAQSLTANCLLVSLA